MVAVVTDLRSRRIPNWLTFPAILAGLVLNTVLPPLFLEGVGWTVGLFSSLTGCLLLLLTFGFLGFINFVGMGDVKLRAAVGALLRWPVALWALAYVALAGGGVAVLYSVLGGKLGAELFAELKPGDFFTPPYSFTFRDVVRHLDLDSDVFPIKMTDA